MSGPLVSVIIPVFNGERFLAEAIRSVFAQDHRPVEVIVVDDGSTDASADVAATFPEVVLIRQANAGPAAARNAGLARATGSFLTFLDADDQMVQGRLSRQLEHLRTHPEVGCVLMKQEVLLERNAPEPSWLRPEHAPDDIVDVHVMSAMVRRGSASVRFDTGFRVGEEIDWLFRLRGSGVVVEVLPAVGIIRRIHADNLSHRRGTVGPPLVRAVREHIQRQRAARPGTQR